MVLPRLNARLTHDECLAHHLGPEATASRNFLPLGAEQHGASFYRRDTMAWQIGVDLRELYRCLDRLLELGLVAHRPWSPSHPDGVWQLLPIPRR